MSESFMFLNNTNSPKNATPHYLNFGHEEENNFRNQAESFRHQLPQNPDAKSSLDPCHHSEHNQICIYNHITELPQYKAYRLRQAVHSQDSREDNKWPLELEAHLFDALMDVPHMGRHKYTLNGKPHGRNELISLYIWTAYKKSLPAGEVPDPRMNRDRKQISSHIQVLKKFTHDGSKPFELICQSAESSPDNRSFENNPCLIALSEGRLPDKTYKDEVRRKYSLRLKNSEIPSNQTLLITYPQIGSRNFGPYTMSMPGINFPEISLMNYELYCQIIHVHMILAFPQIYPGEDQNFPGHTILSLPGTQAEGAQWKITTSFVPPMESYNSHRIGMPMKSEVFSGEVLYKSLLETRILIPFPVNRWSLVYPSLCVQKSENERPVEKASMCQIVCCYSGSDPLGNERAVIFWTFDFKSNVLNSYSYWRHLSSPATGEIPQGIYDEGRVASFFTGTIRAPLMGQGQPYVDLTQGEM